jgi:transcriptional regulator with XRE-family HTH domain
VPVIVFAAMDGRTPLRERIGARVRALRLERGWSVAEFCARLGWSRSYYYKVESGELGLSWEGLTKMARVFRLDEVDLLMFPDANPLRHGIYDLLRRASEPALLRTKLFILEELERRGEGQSEVIPVESSAPKVKAVGRKRKGAAR